MDKPTLLSTTKPYFKTFKTNDNKSLINHSFTTSYKPKYVFESTLSPSKQTRSLYNRLDNAQKRIEHIENDQKSVKRLLNSLRGNFDETISEESIYVIEKLKVSNQLSKDSKDESFLMEIPSKEISNENSFRIEILKEILMKMNMFKKTYSCKNNLERILKHITNRIEKNNGLYFDFINENNNIHLKIFVQILYDVIENFMLNYSKLNGAQETQRNSYEQKIKELNAIIFDKIILLENIQNNKNITHQTLNFYRKAIEEMIIHIENSSSNNNSQNPLLEKLKILLKDSNSLEQLQDEYKSVDYTSLEAYKEDFVESKKGSPNKINAETQEQISCLQSEIMKYKDLLIEKEKRIEENQELKKLYVDYKRKYELKEKEVLELQKKLEDTRKEIADLSKDLMQNSKEKENFLHKINEENVQLSKIIDELSQKNEKLLQENALLEKKFEDQLIVFKQDLQKAWKTILELTEKKKFLENEKETLFKKLNEEVEAKDKYLREAMLIENKNIGSKLEKYEQNFQDLLGEKAILEEKIMISEENLNICKDKIVFYEKEIAALQQKELNKKENLIDQFKKELKQIFSLESTCFKDMNFLIKFIKQIIDILHRSTQNPLSTLALLKEEVLQKKDEIWQNFQHNYDDFLAILNSLKNKYDFDFDLEELNMTLFTNLDKNNKSFSEISLKSLKNFESTNSKKEKKENIIGQNAEMMIYLQACSLENILEQLQNSQNNSKLISQQEEEKNNLSLDVDLEKIKELSEDDETHTQPSNC